MNNVETIVIFAVILLALFVILPSVLRYDDSQCSSNTSGASGSANASESTEGFTAQQQMQTDNSSSDISSDTGSDSSNGMVSGVDPMASMDGGLTPRGASKNYESLIYDNTTRTIMTGSQFMENTGIIAPPWVAPAWNPDAYGPSSKSEMNPEDYEDDPRMLYNKCSLSCCSPQYPTPFQGDSDPFVCDKNGNNKYLASNYVCQNNTGGTGCLCMSPKQVKGMENGFVDYYVDKKNLGY